MEKNLSGQRKIASIVMPVYNAEDYLKVTLPVLKKAMPANAELVIVDDASRDNSLAIARQYADKVVELDQNHGHPEARNRGLKEVDSDLYIAIDADILVSDDTIRKIINAFEEDLTLSAVTGLLSAEKVSASFFTDYKNLYMNYIFKQCSEAIDFLYGSIHAVRMRDMPMEGYLTDVGRTDDTDLGMRLTAQGKKVRLLKNLEVEHLKKYSFVSLLKNDFFIPFDWTKVFYKNFSLERIIKKKGFAHAKTNQLVSLILVVLIVAFWGAEIFTAEAEGSSWCLGTSFLLLFAWVLTNARFFNFIKEERIFFFLLKAIPFTFLDQLIMTLGMLSGFIINGIKRK